tara:strand:- start:36000 stop:36680 length:681 start_codon:yes stop_codon:yes gene_type:complete
MLSVIIPCFNEEKIIKNSIQRLLNWSENKNFYVEILIVNNNSTDKTQEELNDFKNIENVLIIEELNKGKGFAVKKGLTKSQFDNILILDADLSTDINQFDEKWLDENEIFLIGSRPLGNEIDTPIKRKSAGKILNFILRKIFNIKFFDTQCGFKFLKTRNLQILINEISIGGFLYDVDLILSCIKNKIKVKEYPVEYFYNSDSSVSLLKDSMLMLKDVLILRRKYD